MPVRTITTGHVEADMLGNVYLWLSERSNRKYPQRPHKTYKRRQPKSIYKWSLMAPTACWRRLKELISYSNKYGRKLASVMRRNKLNGK